MFVLVGGSTGYPTTTWKTHNARTAIGDRNRVGSEWILSSPAVVAELITWSPLTPLDPLLRATSRPGDAMRPPTSKRDSAISTVFGQQLDATQYHEWRRLNGN